MQVLDICNCSLCTGLCHDDRDIVSACIRTLRTLYSSDLAPSDMIFSNVSVPHKLVSLMSASPQISQCASIVLAKACQVYIHSYTMYMYCRSGNFHIVKFFIGMTPYHLMVHMHVRKNNFDRP